MVDTVGSSDSILLGAGIHPCGHMMRVASRSILLYVRACIQALRQAFRCEGATIGTGAVVRPQPDSRLDPLDWHYMIRMTGAGRMKTFGLALRPSVCRVLMEDGLTVYSNMRRPHGLQGSAQGNIIDCSTGAVSGMEFSVSICLSDPPSNAIRSASCCSNFS